eukprot:s3117_g4.t1
MLRGSLDNTWCEVPTSHVFGRRVESQIFQRRIECFAKPMSKGAVYLAATCNARALRQSSQVKDLARFLWCMMKLLASQIFQLAQTTAMQISRNVFCKSHLPPPCSLGNTWREMPPSHVFGLQAVKATEVAMLSKKLQQSNEQGAQFIVLRLQNR